jgi:hypothetical protein
MKSQSPNTTPSIVDITEVSVAIFLSRIPMQAVMQLSKRHAHHIDFEAVDAIPNAPESAQLTALEAAVAHRNGLTATAQNSEAREPR